MSLSSHEILNEGANILPELDGLQRVMHVKYVTLQIILRDPELSVLLGPSFPLELFSHVNLQGS